MTGRFVNFSEAQSPRQTQVLEYNCQSCSHEEFGTVYKVINRTRITHEELLKHSKLLNYFQILDSQVLVDLSVDPEDATKSEVPTQLEEWSKDPSGTALNRCWLTIDSLWFRGL